ncbi:hypothetical protein [Methanobrevibacter sp.]|uniref:hypothetical protein n=1 Tax=Methanobrevibacter sp. TaxID=66852 RepID=UPI0029E94996|nr:hypothetical protein [Methanobrevibacter sp.]
MKMEKSLVNKISESGYQMDTLEILDHVIAIQLDKIEYIHTELTSPVGETSEKVMENMIKLLEIRYNRKE